MKISDSFCNINVVCSGGALQYEMDMGVRLRLPNPGAFGESEEKKIWGHRVRVGQSDPKLSKFSKILWPFGENGSKFDESFRIFQKKSEVFDVFVKN